MIHHNKTQHISYAESGSGDIPIICLHGIGGSQASFDPQLETLGKHWRVIAWDMPGYGESPLLAETSFTSLCDALCQFMDDLGIQKAHIMGQSIGGMIAQEMALTHPERVATLALIATTPAFGGRDESFKQQFLADRLKPLDEGQTLASLAKHFVPQIVGSIAAPKAIEAATETMSQVPDESYRAILKCLVTFSRYADTKNITQNTMLIAGSEDTNAPSVTMKKMADKLSNGQYHEVLGAGHLLNLEAPYVCNELLANFYASATLSD